MSADTKAGRNHYLFATESIQSPPLAKEEIEVMRILNRELPIQTLGINHSPNPIFHKRLSIEKSKL